MDMAELLKDNAEVERRRLTAGESGQTRLRKLDAMLQHICCCSVCQVPTKGKGVVGIPGPNDSQTS